jgi:hypothetical protein
MRRTNIATLLLLTAFTQAQGQKNTDASKLVALENAWNQAQLHHDSEALETLVASDFVYTDYDGTVMNRAAFLKDLKDPAFRATLITNDDVKVHMYSSGAVVFGSYHTKGTYNGKPVDHRGRFTDTWVYRDKAWQCVASHTNLVSK